MSYQPRLSAVPEPVKNELPVTEIFYSLQGEGRFVGSPAVFVRLKYCNLGCAWCDTRFTWDAERIEDGELMTPGAIVETCRQLIEAHVARPQDVHIVITGGEPMLHQDQLPQLCERLRAQGFSFIEIETNGMYVPSAATLAVIDWWNCSPKLSNSGIPVLRNRVPAALGTIIATQKCDFKFVIQSPKDIDEMERYYLPPIPAEKVILMPEGVTSEAQLRIMPWLMEECAKRGYRFSPRLHILGWGNERGR